MEDLEFIRSEHCMECGGSGRSVHNHRQQCEECEYIHNMEVMADIIHDEMKEA